MANPKFAAIICLLMGPGLLVMGIKENAERKKIDKEGVQTAAIPVAKIDSRGRKGSHTYKVELQYPVQGAGNQKATAEISEGLYNQLESKPFMEIKYLKEQPSKLIVVGEPVEEHGKTIGGGVLFLVGVIWTWWVFFRKKKEESLAETRA